MTVPPPPSRDSDIRIHVPLALIDIVSPLLALMIGSATIFGIATLFDNAGSEIFGSHIKETSVLAGIAFAAFTALIRYAARWAANTAQKPAELLERAIEPKLSSIDGRMEHFIQIAENIQRTQEEQGHEIARNNEAIVLLRESQARVLGYLEGQSGQKLGSLSQKPEV